MYYQVIIAQWVDGEITTQDMDDALSGCLDPYDHELAIRYGVR